MPKSGRLTLVKSVLCAMPIHAMMALDIPMKTIAAMNKVCRGFLWCKRANANGGNCAVTWDPVCAPKWAGGLGIPNLKWLNVAMQARWPWLQRVDLSRPWSEFTIKVPAEALCLFQAATKCEAHCGQNTLFWEDRWLDGNRIQEVAPFLYSLVPKRIRDSRFVGPAVENGSWALDVGPGIGPAVLHECFLVWQLVSAWEPMVDGPDKVGWAWEATGQFSVKSAYAASFGGREGSLTADLTWKSRAPSWCRFFTWLALRDRCWTADQLARRWLPHQDACPFCDQEDEIIDHILLTCVFARTVWRTLCSTLGKPQWSPTAQDNLNDWCVVRTTSVRKSKELRALLTLGLWELWKNRNALVFECAAPSLQQVVGHIVTEGKAWQQASLSKGEVDSMLDLLVGWVESE